MRKIFLILGSVLIVFGIYWVVRYGFILPSFDFLNPFGKSELDLTEEKLLKRVADLEKKSDSLAPILLRYQHTTDSLMKNDSLIDLKVLDLKKKDLILEKKLTQSRDSLNKYRNNLKDVMSRYEKLKKNPKKSSNKEALDFFKKYS